MRSDGCQAFGMTHWVASVGYWQVLGTKQWIRSVEHEALGSESLAPVSSVVNNNCFISLAVDVRAWE